MDVPLALPLPLPPPDLPPPLARNEFSPLEGGIASVLMIDLVLFALAFSAFVAIRYHALTRPPPCLLRTQSTSRFKRFLQLVFRRYNTHNRELEEPTMFGWIWRTIAMSNDEVLARTGRDCFLYLYLQRMFIGMLFVCTCVGLPIMVPVYAAGQLDTSLFLELTALHLAPRAPELWLTTGWTIAMTVMMLTVLFLSLRAIRYHKELEKRVIGSDAARMFTVKISHFPKHIYDPGAVYEFFNTLFPNKIFQVYVVMDYNELWRTIERLKESKLLLKHYKGLVYRNAANVQQRPMIYKHSFWARHCCCGEAAIAAADNPEEMVDAVDHYERLTQELFLQHAELLKNSRRKPAGVVFVTFRTTKACSKFLESHAAGVYKRSDYISALFGIYNGAPIREIAATTTPATSAKRHHRPRGRSQLRAERTSSASWLNNEPLLHKSSSLLLGYSSPASSSSSSSSLLLAQESTPLGSSVALSTTFTSTNSYGTLASRNSRHGGAADHDDDDDDETTAAAAACRQTPILHLDRPTYRYDSDSDTDEDDGQEHTDKHAHSVSITINSDSASPHSTTTSATAGNASPSAAPPILRAVPTKRASRASHSPADLVARSPSSPTTFTTAASAIAASQARRTLEPQNHLDIQHPQFGDDRHHDDECDDGAEPHGDFDEGAAGEEEYEGQQHQDDHLDSFAPSSTARGRHSRAEWLSRRATITLAPHNATTAPAPATATLTGSSNNAAATTTSNSLSDSSGTGGGGRFRNSLRRLSVSFSRSLTLLPSSPPQQPQQAPTLLDTESALAAVAAAAAATTATAPPPSAAVRHSTLVTNTGRYRTSKRTRTAAVAATALAARGSVSDGGAVMSQQQQSNLLSDNTNSTATTTTTTTTTTTRTDSHDNTKAHVASAETALALASQVPLDESFPSSSSMGSSTSTNNVESAANVPAITRSRLHQLHKLLEPNNWAVSRAPHAQDIVWQSLGVPYWKVLSISVVVNTVLVTLLFFFTTPLAMIGTIASGLTSSLLEGIKHWLAQSQVGTLVAGYTPSLILLFLMTILPHILYYTTWLEYYETISSQNRWGMIKMYSYQLTAVLVLPNLALTSLVSLTGLLSVDGFETLMQNVGLFPNSPFYVKYVMQAAFVGGMLDMFRSSEMLFEKAYKFMATTPAQLEESERPFPYEFGFHYSYMIMIISVTLFYSTVVPIIMPVGFLFICLKHTFDKYNLCFVYTKPPQTDNYMTKVAAIFLLVALNIYQLAMASFMFYSKDMFEAGIVIVITWIVTNMLGWVAISRYFKHLKEQDAAEIKTREVNLEWFRDQYLHPALAHSEKDEALAIDSPSPTTDAWWASRRHSVMLQPHV